jgi:AcrR family transcriptional regulator
VVKTREKLLIACEELAMKKGRGFYNLSLVELAKEAGVSKRTIYRHFDSKEELFEATVDKVANKIMAQNIELFASEKDMKAIILGILKNVTYLFNGQIITDLSTYYPLLWQKIDTFRQNKVEMLMNHLINNSQAKMHWRVDPSIFKASISAAMTEVLSPHFIVESGMSFEEVGYNFLDMFMFGAIEPINNSIGKPECEINKN